MQLAWPEATIHAAESIRLALIAQRRASGQAGGRGGSAEGQRDWLHSRAACKLQRDPLTCPGAMRKLAMWLFLLQEWEGGQPLGCYTGVTVMTLWDLRKLTSPI